MYSQSYRCRVHYFLLKPDAQPEPVPYRVAFRDVKDSSKICHTDTLPRFHEWLCEELEVRDQGYSLRADINCSLSNGPYIPLVNPNVDVCTAPHFGILVP